MGKTYQGTVLKYGENINTDLIAPSQYGPCSSEIQVAHAMEGVDPLFSKRVKSGDIIVATSNFGCGSSRETAPTVIKNSGIAAVVASSFARIFFRNAINIGLPLLISNDVDRISDGDIINVDPIEGVIRNISRDEVYHCTKLPEHLIQLLEDGGLIDHILKAEQRNFTS